ncbi:ATP-binding protein [Dactylosporangium sp. NBC_01737]|uniref:ATP-binding protein n=1 Tax=Dactylosporangium sp. NBC_01737 TaxID=2975959 RepID=UPI002E0F4D5D|nr:ATP-binding protein [Dactylosporangium sp. NBC_01737]
MRDDPDAPPVLVALPPVTVTGVAEVRRRVTEAAAEVGLSPERVASFTVAVNEIVINAVEHGGGTAVVTLILEPERLVVEVVDHGTAPWQFSVPAAAPPPDQPHGRGLWLATKLSDELTVDARGADRLVRLTANAGGR